MAGFVKRLQDKLQRLFPNTLDSIDDTTFALSLPSQSGIMSSGIAIGGVAGGVLGVGLGVAAMAVTAFSSPLLSLAILNLGGALVAPVVLGAGLGAVGAGIGYGAGAIARVGLGVIGAAFGATTDLCNMANAIFSRRSKTFAGNGLKWGGAAGGALGLASGIASFAALPALGTAFGIVTAALSGAILVGAAAAVLSLPVAGIANMIDAARGKDPSLSGRQEKAVGNMLKLRQKRVQAENLLEYYAAEGRMPHLKEALPQEVYEKLSDAGKMAAMAPVFDARDNGAFESAHAPTSPRLKGVFDKFAKNARNILTAEQESEAAATAAELQTSRTLSRARDKRIANANARLAFAG